VKALETGIYFHIVLLGNQEGGSSIGEFQRWMKKALGIGHFSLKRLTVDSLWGVFCHWGPARRVKKGSRYRRISP
jgi:hypothetical protein